MLRKLVSLVLVLTLTFVPRTSTASGLPVVDVANLVDNIRAYIQMAMAYEQDYQHYVQWIDQYKDLKLNWKAKAIGYLLITEARAHDDRKGFSALSAAQWLNADAGDWRDSIESLIRSHYAVPRMQSMIQDALETHDGSISPLIKEWQRQYKQRTPLYDAYHFEATQQRAKRNRLDTLQDVQRMLDSLTDKSETAQLQAIGSALTLIARQGESQMDVAQMQLTQNQRDELIRIDGQERVRAAYIALARANRPAQNPCGSNGCVSHNLW